MNTPNGSSTGTGGSDTAHSAGAGYTWAGDLREIKVNSIYAACHSLRFTGRLDLKDSTHAAQVVFVGGDPVEIDGGDTKVIALWSDGQFRAVQCLPNLNGELTDQIEQDGSLAAVKASRLIAWVSEYRLSCELKMERPGEIAVLLFRHGQLESADMNGRPELAALARVQAWTDGAYRVILRPLFQGGAVSLAPPPLEGAAPEGRVFDVSKSIPLDLRQKAKMIPTPAGVVSFGQGGDARVEPDRPGVDPAPMPRLRSTEPGVEAATRMAEVLSRPIQVRSARWPWVLLIVGSLAGAGAAVAYTLHLPPFPPAPRPVDEPKPTPAPPIAAVEPTPTPTPDPKPTPEPAPTEAVEPTKPGPVDPVALEPKGAESPGGDTAEASPLDARLIEKGRLVLVEGHPHSALSLFRKAEQINSKNTLARTLQQQAMGKLGRAEIIIDGKGELTIDGKRFDGGKKLKVFAGPHAVDSGQGPEELVLKKGERRHLRAR